MPYRILYQSSDGGVAVIIPSPEAVADLGINEIARKDVPAGAPYKIIDTALVPADRTFRNAWEGDFTTPDGVGVGVDAWIAEKASA